MKKLVFRIIQITVFTMLQAGVVHAQWYIGTGVGQTSMEIQAADQNFTDTQQIYAVDFNDKSYKLFGGWVATPSLMVEIGYADLGKYKEHYSEPGFNLSVETGAKAYYTAFVGRMELGSNWNFLGKLGLAYWDAEVNYEDSTPIVATGSGNGLDPVLGLGFEYKIDFGATALGMRLEWEQYQNFQEGVVLQTSSERTYTYNGADINMFGLSAIFEF